MASKTKKKTPNIFDHSDNLPAEIARSNSPTLRVPPEANQKHVSDLDDDVDIGALLSESLPDSDCEPAQLTLFVKRQYKGYQSVGKRSAHFQYRMGCVLLREKASKKHGEWEDYINTTYNFTSRAARNWMRLSESVNEDEAKATPATELMQELGILNAKKDPNPPQPKPRIETTGNIVKSIVGAVEKLKEQTDTIGKREGLSVKKNPDQIQAIATKIDLAIQQLFKSLTRIWINAGSNPDLDAHLTQLFERQIALLQSQIEERKAAA